jgi:hypothetical protein
MDAQRLFTILAGMVSGWFLDNVTALCLRRRASGRTRNRLDYCSIHLVRVFHATLFLKRLRPLVRGLGIAARRLNRITRDIARADNGKSSGPDIGQQPVKVAQNTSNRGVILTYGRELRPDRLHVSETG